VALTGCLDIELVSPAIAASMLCRDLSRRIQLGMIGSLEHDRNPLSFSDESASFVIWNFYGGCGRP
jgi:hypothetical protein